MFQKIKLKAWDFTQNKLCHRYFDNNLHKIFENGTGQIILIFVLMVGLRLRLQMEIFN